jgi:hypothetical protein
MVKFISKQTGELLHIVNKFNDIKESRIDVIPEDNFLQLAVLKMPNKKTFRPHFHIPKKIDYNESIAQESWVVIKGKVKCTFYDIDNTIIATPILTSGDVSITLKGGHTFEILEEDTIVYEFKTGPYLGVELDKEFIK